MGIALLLAAALGFVILSTGGKTKEPEDRGVDLPESYFRSYVNPHTGQSFVALTREGFEWAWGELAKRTIADLSADPSGASLVRVKMTTLGAEGPNAAEYLKALLSDDPNRQFWLEVLTLENGVVSDVAMQSYPFPLVLAWDGEGGTAVEEVV